jgi:DNA-binding transcriptional LysR family regulator
MLAITLKQLETFVAVAESGGFRRAADRLNLSQSAVTAHVKSLEGHLGVPLFHRTTRSVRLTAAGEDLLAQAARTLSGIDEIAQRFQAEAAVERGRVTVASAPSFAASLLPGLLAAYHARHPDVVVEVREAYAPEILDAVHADRADFGIGPTDAAGKDMEVRPLLADSFVALVSADHPLASAKTVKLESLSQETLLLMPRMSETRRQLDAAFTGRGLILEPTYEVLHHQTLIALAEAGVGIGVLPSVALMGAGSTKCRQLPIVDPDFTRQIGILTRRDHALSPAAAALIDLATKTLSISEK